MRTNKTVRFAETTHEGARAVRTTDEQALTRSVMSCMLWEDEFYEEGEEIADRIRGLVSKVAPTFAAETARRARGEMHLRHVPLLIVREMARLPGHKVLVADTLENVIQRADELGEFVSLYWREGKCKLSAQVKKGLARAFAKFDEYNFSKYRGDDKAVKLRDVMFLVHPCPANRERADLYGRIANRKLETPDTWEVSLSGGADKKATFLRLMSEKKLGGLAFLRNLRNMQESGVPKSAVADYAETVDLSRVLPFRFVSAARAVPAWEDVIEPMFLRASQSRPKLPGKTVVIVDVSGSMYSYGNVSSRSDISRVDAAGALAAIARESCEEVAIYATAGNDYTMVHQTKAVPPRRGFALVEQFSEKRLGRELGGGGIFLTQCMDYVRKAEKSADRVIVFTDEQDCDKKCNPAKADAFGRSNYLINVSSHKSGIGYGKWTHIDGWSEAILDYIGRSEFSQQ